MASGSSFLKLAYRYRNQILAILVPVILLPLPLVLNDERATCGYVVLLMASSWLLQIVPVPVTGMIPFVVLPMLGISTPEEVASQYLLDFSVTFMVGFVLAGGMEKSGLHKRFALNILILTGSKQYLLVMGLMVPTFLLSMWISNMAVCVMMVAIAQQVVSQLQREALSRLKKQAQANMEDDGGAMSKVPTNILTEKESGVSEGYVNKGASLEDENINMNATELEEKPSQSSQDSASDSGDNDSASSVVSGESTEDLVGVAKADKEAVKSWFHNLQTCFILGITYAAKIGGACTLSGNNTNLRTQDLADDIWQENGYENSPITFSSWIILNLPAQTITLFLIWGWFCMHFFWWGGCSLKPGARRFARVESEAVVEFLRQELKALGKIKYEEYMVLFMLTSLVMLWFFLDPDFMTGWSTFFESGYVTVSTPAGMLMVAMMIVPGKFAWKSSDKSTEPVTSLGDYDAFLRTFPWGVFIMVGGGNALAEAMTKTGLSDWIAQGLTGMEVLPDVVLMLILSLMVTMFTEVIADMVAIAIFVPIAGQLSENIGMNPLYLIFPVSLSATYSFMSPMAAAVNAWVLTSGLVTVNENIRVGGVINVLCVLVTLLSMHTWGYAYFDLDTIPWATDNTTLPLDNTTTVPLLAHI